MLTGSRNVLLIASLLAPAWACDVPGEPVNRSEADPRATREDDSPAPHRDGTRDASARTSTVTPAAAAWDAGRGARAAADSAAGFGAAGFDAAGFDAAGFDAAGFDAVYLDAAASPDTARSVTPEAGYDAHVVAPEQGDAVCPDGFARGEPSLVLARIAAFTPSPEGVTVCPGGEVFVTVDGPDEVRQVPLDGGAPQLYASLVGIQPAGIDCDERGRLFVAGLSRRDGAPDPPIVMVTRQGATPVHLPPPAGSHVNGLNGIAVVKGAGVFASDTGGGTLLLARELPDGGFETTVAAADVLGANGLMYEPRTRRLHMVTSFLPTRVLSFQVGADGSLTDRKEETYAGLLEFHDGVAVDADGTLYVADYPQGVVRRARDRTTVATLAHPASFAFRGGSLLVTSYHLGDPRAEGGLYALQLGVCGPGREP